MYTCVQFAPMIEVPPLKLLPQREFTPRFLAVREEVYKLIDPYYDREHLTRAGDWMLAIEPDAPEYLVLAALTHDLERSVPGGPQLDIAREPWDDPEYNRAHCGRSAELVPGILADCGADEATQAQVQQPIREHEFGGSPEGDLMQAADSLSFLETNSRLCVRWVIDGKCSRQKAREKLDWMYERIRYEPARDCAADVHARAVADFERMLDAAVEPQRAA